MRRGRSSRSCRDHPSRRGSPRQGSTTGSDGMRIDWDVPITMDDGLVLRADVYRPPLEGKHPVILTYGPYGKWLHFEDLYTEQGRAMGDKPPHVPAGSTNTDQNRAGVDPATAVPDGHPRAPARAPGAPP